MAGSPRFETLSEHVWRVGGGDLSFPQDAAAYLVGDGERFCLVDCGTGRGGEALLRNVAGICPEPAGIETLLLTHAHADHVGGAAAVVAATGCRVAIHRGDRAYLERGDPRFTAASWYHMQLAPVAADTVLSGSHGTLPVGALTLQWLHTPGHTPGSIVAVLDEADGTRVLLGQDLHGPFHDDFRSDRAAWRRSMAAVQALDADVLGEGHYGVFVGRAAVREFIADLLHRIG